MNKVWKKGWLRSKVEKESEKGEKLVQKEEKGAKSEQKWRKRQNLGSRNQICANLKSLSL